MLPNKCLSFWNLGGVGGSSVCFTSFSTPKKMLAGPSPILCSVCVCVPRFCATCPTGWLPACSGQLYPPPPSRQDTVSLQQGWCARQLLALAEGPAEGKGQDAFARTLCGHSFSRKGGGNCHPRAAHSTKMKELPKEVGAVGLDPLWQRRDLNLGNLLSGWDFKAGTTPPLPLTRPEVRLYTQPSLGFLTVSGGLRTPTHRRGGCWAPGPLTHTLRTRSCPQPTSWAPSLCLSPLE